MIQFKIGEAYSAVPALEGAKKRLVVVIGRSGRYIQLAWWLRHQERICLQYRRPRFNPWVGKIHWRGEWLPIPVFLPGEFP